MTPDRYETEFSMHRGHTPSYAAPPLVALFGRRRDTTGTARRSRDSTCPGPPRFPGRASSVQPAATPPMRSSAIDAARAGSNARHDGASRVGSQHEDDDLGRDPGSMGPSGRRTDPQPRVDGRARRSPATRTATRCTPPTIWNSCSSLTVEPWRGHYLTGVDVGRWKHFRAARVGSRTDGGGDRPSPVGGARTELPGLQEIALEEANEFDRCRTVRLSR